MVDIIGWIKRLVKKDKPSLKVKPSQYTLKDIRTEKAVDKYLENLWEEMMDDHPHNKLRFEGAVNLATGLGIFTDEKRELWNLRIEKCPYPDHIGGRCWCAYCGDIDTKEADE